MFDDRNGHARLTNPQSHLLLGGAGFIGRHVAAGLLSRGHRVTIADRVPAEQPNTLPHPAPEQARSILVDFATADWDALVQDADVVHHYAWNSIPASANANPFGDLSTNLGVTLGLLEALRRRGGGRVVFSSSGGTVYGRTGANPTPETHPLAPITGYGAGKAATEVYLGLYHHLHGLDCRIARIANPYGAGQDIRRGQGAVTTFLQKALDGESIVIWGDGEITRDYIHISDVVKALVRMATIPRIDEPATFNIGSGAGLSLNGIIHALEQRLGRRLQVERKAARSFDVPVNVLDVTKAARLLPWAPVLSFADGLDRTLSDLAAGARLSCLD